MAFKKLNIDEELVKYARFILDRDGISYKADGDGTLTADLDDEGEEILIEDAMCERQRADTDSEFPVYSYRTMCNEEKFARLQRLNWPNDKIPESAPFHLLHEDESIIEEGPAFSQEEIDEIFPGMYLGMPIDEFLELFNKNYRYREMFEESQRLGRALTAREIRKYRVHGKRKNNSRIRKNKKRKKLLTYHL